MELILTQDKVTKNKVVRFADSKNHNLYLQPEEVEALGNPEAIKVTIEAKQPAQSRVSDSWHFAPVWSLWHYCHNQYGGIIALDNNPAEEIT